MITGDKRALFANHSTASGSLFHVARQFDSCFFFFLLCCQDLKISLLRCIRTHSLIQEACPCEYCCWAAGGDFDTSIGSADGLEFRGWTVGPLSSPELITIVSSFEEKHSLRRSSRKVGQLLCQKKPPPCGRKDLVWRKLSSFWQQHGWKDHERKSLKSLQKRKHILVSIPEPVEAG